mmetsp:Transcript_14219/g.37582  ORF Transcript_14219/g.37582 Transcript_14219/m.37582 type:complete len:270 (+) Transcript_14219:349-1158(+)
MACRTHRSALGPSSRSASGWAPTALRGPGRGPVWPCSLTYVPPATPPCEVTGLIPPHLSADLIRRTICGDEPPACWSRVRALHEGAVAGSGVAGGGIPGMECCLSAGPPRCWRGLRPLCACSPRFPWRRHSRFRRVRCRPSRWASPPWLALHGLQLIDGGGRRFLTGCHAPLPPRGGLWLMSRVPPWTHGAAAVMPPPSRGGCALRALAAAALPRTRLAAATVASGVTRYAGCLLVIASVVGPRGPAGFGAGHSCCGVGQQLPATWASC